MTRSNPGESAVIVLDDESVVPPFEQVRAQLASHIIERRLPVGTRLATVRSLATELGLAVNTVARAYHELETAGLVVTKGRGGTFVSAAGDSARDRAYQAAKKYAATIRTLGISPAEAVSIVQAALTS